MRFVSLYLLYEYIQIISFNVHYSNYLHFKPSHLLLQVIVKIEFSVKSRKIKEILMTSPPFYVILT